MSTVLIKGGTVVSATGSSMQDVLVDGETIAALLAPGSDLLGSINADTVIDATGKYVIPGGIGRRTGMELAVEDDGPGIDEENVDHLLQRGVRGDERVQGDGIGLAIVQDILRAYQGELSVKRSEALGGARFAIRFRPR